MRAAASASASSASSRFSRPPAWSASANASSRTRVCSRITSTSARIAGRCSALARTDALEERKAVGDQDPARRRRRVRDHLAAEVRHAHGLAPDHLVRGQVGDRQAAAAFFDRARDLLCELAAVERRRALRGDPLERAGEIREAEEVARLQAGAVGPAVEAASLGGVPEDQVEDRVQVRLRPCELDALPRASSIEGATTSAHGSRP